MPLDEQKEIGKTFVKLINVFDSTRIKTDLDFSLIDAHSTN